MKKILLGLVVLPVRSRMECGREECHTPQQSACWNICQISVVFINGIIPCRTQRKSILSAAWARTKSVVKLGLCTPPTMFFSFATAVLYLLQEHTAATEVDFVMGQSADLFTKNS